MMIAGADLRVVIHRILAAGRKSTTNIDVKTVREGNEAAAVSERGKRRNITIAIEIIPRLKTMKLMSISSVDHTIEIVTNIGDAMKGLILDNL
jgi:hypothetical protein